jgi:hypothetical protein
VISDERKTGIDEKRTGIDERKTDLDERKTGRLNFCPQSGVSARDITFSDF